jgi:PAS domain S-box-containing protein
MANKRLRILLIEDFAADADLIQMHLKKTGFDFLAYVVEDRESYIKALAEFRPNVILSDHSLPALDSKEAFAIYKEHGYDIPFILVTGAVSEEFAAETIKSGVDDYVLKSNLTRLPAAIRSSLQKKASEHKNKIAEERIARAQRIAGLGHWEWDLIDNTMEWSDETYRIFGIEPEKREAGFERFTSAVHPDDRDMVSKALQQMILKGAEYNLDHRILREDGTIRFVNEQADVLHDAYGHAVKITGALLDITERKMFEQRLDNERKFLQAVLDNINVGIQACNPEGKIILYNDALKAIQNLPPFDVPTDNWNDYFKMFDLKNNEQVQTSEDPLSRARNGETIINQSFYIQPTNGASRTVSINAQPLYDQEGLPIGAVSAIHDLTQLKLSEEKLKYKIKELDMFIYKASHDLKGPLSSMAGLLNLAKIEFDNPEVLEYLDKLEQSNNKLEVILHGLLEVVHIKQGRPAVTEICLYALVADVVSSLKNLPKCERMEFIIDVNPDVMLINDERLLRGILQNLIHNAIKYRREITESYIRISAYKRGKQFFIEVQDNGIGIQEELKEKVFDMFFRGHYTSTGSGLGLYIVKNAIEKLNGTIEVHSEYGKQTTFILEFPVVGPLMVSDKVEKEERTKKPK